MFLYILYATMISASPTATSAAAIAMENNANVCPPLCGKNLANATRFRLAAFMTISTANNPQNGLTKLFYEAFYEHFTRFYDTD